MKSILILSLLLSVFSLQTEFIKYEERESIAIITINRPKALNALNSKVLDELDATLDSIDTEIIKAVILTGAGEKSFVAGADIAEMSNLNKKEGELFSKKGNDVFRKIETFEIPIIAAVNAFALGGGCEIAMSCDIRICSDNAIFGQPEVGLGITPGFGGTQRLARLVGMGMAKQMIYTGQNIKADEAKRIRLVNEVYPQAELLNEAIKLAKTIGKNSANAVKNSKKAINEGYDLDIDEAIELEEKIFGECFGTKDQVELMQAFLNKNQKSKEKKEKKEKKEEEDKKNLRPSTDDKKKTDLVPIDDFKDFKYLRSFIVPSMPAILSAGVKENHNSLIVNAGLLGSMWKKPVFVVFIHPSRYTFQFMETTEFFTVSFIKKDLFKKFSIYGQKSGRDVNKEEEAGTHIQFLDNGGITFEEAEEIYVCRIIAKSYLKEENLDTEIYQKYRDYAKRLNQTEVSVHGMYMGEIVGHYKR